MRKETIEVLVIEPDDQRSDYQKEAWMHGIVFRESRERGPELYSCRALPRKGSRIGANDLALARAGENETSEETRPGALPAAPCSACGNGLSEHVSSDKGWYYTAPYSEMAIAESQMHLQAAKEMYQDRFRFSVLIEPMSPDELTLTQMLHGKNTHNSYPNQQLV